MQTPKRTPVFLDHSVLRKSELTSGQEQFSARFLVLSSPSSHQCSIHGSLDTVQLRTTSYVTSRQRINNEQLFVNRTVSSLI